MSADSMSLLLSSTAFAFACYAYWVGRRHRKRMEAATKTHVAASVNDIERVADRLRYMYGEDAGADAQQEIADELRRSAGLPPRAPFEPRVR